MIEYILEGQSVDISPETSIELTISINDIKNASTVNTTYSKSITLPGTDRNNKVFKYCYSNNLFLGYNPNLKKKVELRVDDVSIIVGYQKLMSVKVDGGKISYECILMGNNTSIFDQMQDDLVSALDFSEYDHIYSLNAITNSWTGTCDTHMYYYPWTNYNDYKLTFARIAGLSGETLPLYPGVYCKTIVDKIFSTYGYTYDSNFLNSDLFKSLIIPYTNPVPEDPIPNVVVIDEIAVNHNLVGVGNYYTYGYTVVADPLSIWHAPHIDTPSDGIWSLTITGSSSTGIYGGYTYRFHHGGFKISTRNKYATGDDRYLLTEIGYPQWSLGPIGEDDPVDRTEQEKERFDFTWTYEFPDILEGREIIISPEAWAQRTDHDWLSQLNFRASWSFKSTVFQKGLTEINGVNILPKSLTQKNFLKTIINMFNLYLEREPLDNRVLTIEPYLAYYGRSEDNRDWTYKVDTQTFENTFMSELNSKQFTFTYTKDSDFMNVNYTKNNDEQILGQTIINSRNDFSNTTQEIKLLCSATGIEKLSDLSELTMPSMYEAETDTSVQAQYGLSGFTNVYKTAWNWRILSKNAININTSYFFYNSIEWTTFYTASHIVNFNGTPNTGYTSLLFDVANTGYTYDFECKNLYDEYWEDYLNIIKNPNAKFLICDAYLEPQEIAELRFFQRIFLEDSWYLLNKVVYNPTLGKSKIELLLIPTIELTNYYFTNFRIDGDNIFIGDYVNCYIDIVNLTNETVPYDGYFSLLDSNDQEVQLVAFHGTILKNSTITITDQLYCPNHGNYRVRCKDYNGDFDEMISLHIQLVPYRYENLVLDPPSGVYTADTVNFSFDIIAQDYEFTGCTSGKVNLNDDTIGEFDFTFCSSGLSSITKNFDFDGLVEGINTFNIIVDGVNVGHIHIVAEVGTVFKGPWTFTPTDPNTCIEKDNLIVYYTIGNHGFSTVHSVIMDMYYDNTRTNKVYDTIVLANQTIPNGGRTFTFNYNNLPSPIANPTSLYLEATYVSEWYDTPIDENKYPFTLQPCEFILGGEFDEIVSPVTGNTTQTISMFISNDSCKQIDAADYILQYVWYKDSGTTVHTYTYPTSLDIPSGTTIKFTSSLLLPNNWTVGRKDIKVNVSILSGDWVELGANFYTYYQAPMSASLFHVQSSGMTYNGGGQMQMNHTIHNENAFQGSVQLAHTWYDPFDTVIHTQTQTITNIQSGATGTNGQAVYVTENVDGIYTCDTIITYISTGITGSPTHSEYNCMLYKAMTSVDANDLTFTNTGSLCTGDRYWDLVIGGSQNYSWYIDYNSSLISVTPDSGTGDTTIDIQGVAGGALDGTIVFYWTSDDTVAMDYAITRYGGDCP